MHSKGKDANACNMGLFARGVHKLLIDKISCFMYQVGCSVGVFKFDWLKRSSKDQDDFFCLKNNVLTVLFSLH